MACHMHSLSHTTADLAFLPQNLTLQEYYWTEPPLLGMRGVPIADIVDIDEAGFFLEHSDQKFGKTILFMRCCQNGVYGHGEKVNLLLAICGDNVGRMRWHEQWMEGGTTIARFYGFIDHILDNLDQIHLGRLFVFTNGQSQHTQKSLGDESDFERWTQVCVSCSLLACRWSC
jgi:hypothetical protein